MTTSTTLMPLDPALTPQQVNRVITISADLLPEEVVAARRGRRTRGWVLAVVGVVVLALGGWYLIADHSTSEANADLEAVNSQQARLQRQQTTYADVVDVQAETVTISKQLRTLFANDLQWAALIDRLRTAGTDSEVTVDSITANLNADGGNGSASSTLPSTSGEKAIGTITITGSAKDKPSIAAYVDLLDTLPTVADPFVTSVSASDDKKVSYELTVNISDDALCGRFTTKCKTTGGN
jgi:hypothetical protein